MLKRFCKQSLRSNSHFEGAVSVVELAVAQPVAPVAYSAAAEIVALHYL